MRLTEPQRRERARQVFEAVIRDADRLTARIERLFPGAMSASGEGEPAPEVIVGLGQARVYSKMALQLSDYGMDEMLKRFAGRRLLSEEGRDG